MGLTIPKINGVTMISGKQRVISCGLLSTHDIRPQCQRPVLGLQIPYKTPINTSIRCRSTQEVKETAPVPSAEVWQWSESRDAVKTYSVFVGILLCGLIPEFQMSKVGDLVYFVSLAVTTIYIGAHRGLNSKERQTITLKQSILAPVMASLALFGSYILIKYFPDFNLQTLLDVYFFLLASFATIGAFTGPLRSVAEKMQLQHTFDVKVPKFLGAVDSEEHPIESLPLYSSDVVVSALGLTLAVVDLLSHHGNFTVSNTIACLIAADILQLIGISSFRVAGILLVGMLVYDVTWVFASPAAIGENVMLKVATSTDVMNGPTRLIFPKIPGSMGEASSFPFALLGLGDIAIPGLLCCLALRYDASRSIDIGARGRAAAEAILESISRLTGEESRDEVMNLTGTAAEDAYDRIADMELENRNRSQGEGRTEETGYVMTISDAVLYNRVYFMSIMVAYVLGLVAAFAANEITGLGQPALLYLVPSCMGALIFTSMSRKEFDRLWRFRDLSKKQE
jgi:minor histocompatibility antigen H13